MYWIISANGKMYDHASSFQKNGYIDWRQVANYNVGDVVYIYCTKPFKKIMFKTIVEKESISPKDITDDYEFWIDKTEYRKDNIKRYARLKLENQSDIEKLSLHELIKNGLKAAPQGPVKIKLELVNYIEQYMDDYNSENYFCEINKNDNYYEGATHSVLVNKYERSSIARQKCIEYNGLNCFVCDMNFEKKYGKLGKDFIHIHHIIPLNKIKKEYIINYKNDLIPVCPNCHAMLHRKFNGKYYSWKELKTLINNS